MLQIGEKITQHDILFQNLIPFDGHWLWYSEVLDCYYVVIGNVICLVTRNEDLARNSVSQGFRGTVSCQKPSHEQEDTATPQDVPSSLPSAMTSLDHAKAAVKALIEEQCIATEEGLGERERDLSHAQHWEALKKAVGLTDLFCSVCGGWYSSAMNHQCF